MGKINLGEIELTQAYEVGVISGNVASLSSTTSEHTANTTVHMTSNEKTNLDSLEENITAISGITSAKIGNWDNASSTSHSHNNKTSLDSITGTVGTMAYQAASSYSSATQVNTALSNKVDKVSGKGLSTNDYTTDEKNKLSAIASGAEVNQNAFSNVKVGSTTVAADSKTDTLEIAGSGIVSVTADATNDKITISASNAVTSVAGKTGAVTLAKGDVGLGNVDNTADTNKTVKAATSAQTADSAKAVALSGVSNADDLKAIEALTGTSGFLKKTAANTWSLDTNTYSKTSVAVTGATYNSTNKTIDLKNAAGTVVSSVDATAFIKDGMVSNVEVKDVASSGTCLVITFNTDAGKDAINIPISQIFDANNYYTKTELTGSSTTVVVAKASSASTAANASSVALSNVSGADDLKKIEALTGTSGLLKKTAANTWTLDTTDYSNKNAFGKIKINAESTTIDSDTTNDTLTISGGSFVTLTSDAANDKFTIGVSTGTTSATLARGDHNHDSAYQAKGSYLTGTTKYASSSTQGGAATSAEKLTNTSAIGSTTNPVFFTANGVPSACTYSLNKTVPANAVFTDTDTKVTSVGNHYAPTATSADTKSAAASSTSELNWGSAVVTGVTLSGDAKGHITSVTVASGKLKTPVTGVTLASGTNNGTVKLTVNGSAKDNIAVKGLNTMAYQATSSYSSATQVNTALGGKSNTGHTHDDRYYTESELTGSSTTVVVAKAASATTAASAGAVAWGNVTGKPSSYTPSAHNQASNTITAMTSYSKPSTTSAIASGDTLNAAIGKLEKALDGKQASGNYLTSHQTVTLASGTNNGTLKITTAAGTTDNIAVKGINTMAYQATGSYSSATQVNTALSGKSDTGHTHDDRYYTESELTGTSTTVVVAKAASATTAASAGAVAWGNVSGKPSSFTPSAHNQASSTINSMNGYVKPSSTSAIATGDTLNAAIGKLENALDGKQAKVGKLGSATQPIYTSAAGTFTTCSTYAGGTKVTLNGTDKGATTATIYAPTSAGTAGQILSSTAGEPSWKTGEIDHYVTNASGTTGTNKKNRTIWTGSADTVTSLYTGLKVMYKIPVAGINAGCTLNINGLGEHPVVINTNSIMTTQYPVGSILPLIYDADQSATISANTGIASAITGCWKIINYDSNSTNIGYTYITNAYYKPAQALNRYMLCFRKNETTVIPASTSSNVTADTKTINTDEFDPFGGIYYYSTTATVATTAVIPNATLQDAYSLDLRYSFNVNGALTAYKEVYVVAEPQSNGKAKFRNPTTTGVGNGPITQTLPTTDDGYIYIYLGIAYGASTITLTRTHPVYEFKNGSIREYVGSFGNMAYQNTSSYSSATQVNTALSGKSDTGHTHDGRYAKNAFSRITVNTTNVDADTTGDTFTITAGSFVSLTGDATNDKLTIGVSTGTTSSTLARGDHSHSNMVTGTGLTADAIVLGAGNSAVKTSGKSIETTLSSTSDAKIPTSKAVATYVTSQMTSVLTYKGSISSNDTLKGAHKVGDTYVVSSAGTYANKSCEVGDYLIANTTRASASTVTNTDWDAINGENQVEDSGSTLGAAGTTISIAKVDGTVLHLTTPSTWTGVAKTGTVTKITTASGLTGGDITTTGTIGLSATGTAGTYGPTANVTGSNNTTIKVPQITTDSYGRVTAVTERTYTSVDHTYTVNNGTFAISGNGTSVASTSANASANSGLNIKSGSNVTITTGASEITIAATNTDTKVTAVGNHYTPTSSTTKSASASGGNALGWSASIISGVTLNVDAAGHVTNVGVSSAKLPANPNTDTKVTSVANHYTITATSADTKSASANGGSALAWSSSIVTGVTLSGDARGHITSVTVASAKLPANPNTDTKVTAVGNHYTPASSTTKSAAASGGNALGWGASIISGVTLNVDAAGHVTNVGVSSAKLPANPNTDTKVTAVGNHYTPTATSADTKSAAASSTSELAWGSAVVTGVTLSGDAKGHITSVTVASGKLKTPVTGVTLASGTNNGTVKLTVNGSDKDNIAVKGLNTMAYQATGSYSSATQVNTALSGKQGTVAKLGSTTKPIYTSAAGTFSECSTYAGGTNVTLNGSSKGASTASFYAPTDAGASGQVLMSTGGTPTWKTGEIDHYVTNTSGATGTANKNRTTWTGSADTVTTLYSGLKVMYKIPVAGINAGCTLNINGLGEHPVVINANTLITTHYPVNSILPLIYDSDQSATISAGTGTASAITGCWKVINYDANTTYSVMSAAELSAGTATSNRVMRADYVKAGLDAVYASKSHNHDGRYAKNAFSRITVNTTNVDADTTGDTFTITAGSFVSLTGDATNDKLTIGVSTGKTSATLARGDHSHSNMVTGSSLTSNDIILGGGSSAIKASGKSIETSLSSTLDTKVPTSKAVADYVTSQMTSVLTYKGAISSNDTLKGAHKVGDTYVVSSAGTYANKNCEVGDYLIANTTRASASTVTNTDWDAINGENQVENKSASLAAAGSSATIATVDGTNLTITTPSTWTGVAKTGTVTKITTASGLTGGDITTTGTIGLSATGTAGTYGPTANVTGSNNTTIKVPQITTDSYGRVTAVTERTYTSVDHTYTVNNGTFAISGNGTSVASTSANASANSGLNIKSGSNVTITTGASEITIAATNTDTKVTAVGNHYTPTSSTTKSASASGGNALGWSASIISGVTLNVDAAGHVTNVGVSSAKLPANPNTDTKVTSVANHYTITATSTDTKSASANGGSALAWSSSIVTGVTLSGDARGHITSVTVASAKLPANPNTDVNVAQAPTSDDKNYEVLFSKSDNNTAETGTTRKDTKLTFNPSVGRLGTVAINHLITGSGTAASTGTSGSSKVYYPAKWTFNNGITVANGDIFTIKIPVAGHSYGVYISLNNGTNYYPVVLNGTSILSTHYPVNTYITVVYESTGTAAKIYPVTGGTTTGTSAAGVFRVINFYDSNSTDISYTNYNNALYKAAEAVNRYQVCFKKNETSYIPASSTNNTTANTKTITTTEFDPFGVIFYFSSAGTVSVNANFPSGTLHDGYPFDLRYSFNVANVLTAQKDVYAVCVPQSNGKVKFRNPTTTGVTSGPISQTLPTTDDGYIYIYLGAAYNTYSIFLAREHPVYQYKNGAIREYVGSFGNMAYKNIAISAGTGTDSIIENSSKAYGSWSHAEGNQTVASGESSHAEGQQTVAIGSQSHTEGFGTTASGNRSHAEGSDTTASGNMSHAEGDSTKASGDYSHAEGDSTKASGYSSHAEGQETVAIGNMSHAEGQYTTASGSSSHAEGESTEANGNSSHAEGYETTASGECSHAEGSYTQANGNASHAEGSGTQASGESSHAEGSNTKAIGNYSHAEGSGTQASGESSHAEGSNTHANGGYSHAEGQNTRANGSYSHAEGFGTTASGNYGSHTEGLSTTANGESSHAEGGSTKAIGGQSHAEGFYTTASGVCSHAEGQSTIANNKSEHASGQFNVSYRASSTFGDSGNTLFSVGNGTSTSARHNAFEIRQNGDIYFTKNNDTIKLQDIIWSGTQAEYDALPTKNNNIIYLIHN